MYQTTLHRAKCTIVLALTVCILMWGLSVAHSSELITHEIDSKEVAKNTLGISGMRRFQVYLPDGYTESKSRYPVLYWLPGWTGGLNGAQYKRPLDDAIQNGVIPPTIAVFVDAYDRFMQGILFLSSSQFGNWEGFLLSELIPFVDREYRTIPDMTGRGLIGWSFGGYSTLILPLLHPNVWGAIGTNDACPWPVCGANYGNRPEVDLLDVYPGADFGMKFMMQLGAKAAPNPDAAIGFDWPKAPNYSETKAKWDAYCPRHPDTVSQHHETLDNLLEIALVVPGDSSGTCQGENISLIIQLERAGITVTRLDSPGGHSSFQNERYIAVAERLLKAMEGAGTSVSQHGKVAALWGAVKQD